MDSKRHGLGAVGRAAPRIHRSREASADDFGERGTVKGVGGDTQEPFGVVEQLVQIGQERHAFLAARPRAGCSPVGGHAAHVAGHGCYGHPVFAGERVAVLQQVGSGPGPSLPALDGAG
ncbi:hypothetical protein [Pseudarthrobacter sulfonivorans]|uniref:hypothetical protein n=1 Tax=Pseudarthrobacter sulfonivorans TaxID=121292 RepID=UPI0037C62169